MGRRLWKLLFLLLPAMVLSGCSQDGGDPVVIRHKPYEREWYRSTTVRRGTLTPELVFSLRMTASSIVWRTTDWRLTASRSPRGTE